ncbi:hypothetical protein I302_105156 [Kwoniella bestiolae CBS 10118]|uniref:Glycoside hydrolase family 93 protein n=1 Tax=Kwoniella bestiolae CBS 10118 TaxID=1296100 RepID=A0AAJ8M807_9TREE
MFLKLFYSLLLVLCSSALALAKPLAKRDFGPVNLWTPPAGTPSPNNYTDPKTNYGRGLLLSGSGVPGVVLSTFEDIYESKNNRPFFPIYRSTDYGGTWTQYSRVMDTQNGWGLRYQPHMIQLQKAVGSYAAGTILIAGLSVPPDLSATRIEIYASTDLGKTWSFVSHVAQGEGFKQGANPIWEPFLLEYNGQIICYYSDERDPAYSQKLVHQVSSDLRTWGPVVNDVTSSNQNDRPGMATVAALPNGKWILTYEFGGAPEGSFSVYYKIQTSPLTFGNIYAVVVKSKDGVIPVGSPYVIYTPVGGNNGLGAIVVNGASRSELFVSRDQGGTWDRVTTQSGPAYSRGLVVAPKPKDILIFAGNQGSSQQITMTATDVNGCVNCS